MQSTQKKNDASIALRVSESLAKDVGRGIARVDPRDMKEIDAEVGDVVQISGKKKTVAKLMPTYADLRGKSIVQIDGIIRKNAQVGIDEKVAIQKTSFQPAKKIVLSPLSVMQTSHRERDIRYIGRLIEGLPLIVGDAVRATLFGSSFQDYKVEETIPSGPVAVQPTTLIRIKETGVEKRKGKRIAYEDIGGLHKEIHRVREMIELPLKYPQVFERLGIDPPKGVLLLGPPGTGKTLIARAVANETEAYFVAVNGPEVIHKFYGESEAKLRGIFDQASKNAPSIIFLDEIDAISPKRESVVGDVEKRVVAQLLALMDGLEDRGNVIVIGATNIPNMIDPALRRPGRFDREISIGIPDRNGRKEILEIHTRGMPLADDVDLDRLADLTHGFVGADLSALSREAAMSCLRSIFPEIEFSIESIPYESLLELEVTMDHFMDAFKDVEPSAIREVSIEIPNVHWDQVGGLKEIKQQLIQAIDWPLKYPELFSYAKAEPPRGILLYGPPGTGKTLLAKAVATESETNFISIKGPELISKWVGESEKGVREVFKKSRQAAPCILFFDEIDAIAPERGSGGSDSHVTERVISQLLTELDGIESLKNVVVLAATNRIDMVDSAILRPGRFDYLIELPNPDEEARLEIFKVHTKDKPLAKDVDVKSMAKITDGLVGADIESICRKAVLLAIEDFVDAFQGKNFNYAKFKIKRKHFQEAINTVRK